MMPFYRVPETAAEARAMICAAADYYEVGNRGKGIGIVSWRSETRDLRDESQTFLDEDLMSGIRRIVNLYPRLWERICAGYLAQTGAMVLIEFPYREDLIALRRKVAPSAKFHADGKIWFMPPDEADEFLAGVVALPGGNMFLPSCCSRNGEPYIPPG